MKILVIRGHNLASLSGDFEVSLEKPPLQNAGLFAITGATGAGKSTLLDAMCLALFDRMPRFLNGRGGALIGRGDEDEKQRLSSLDVRSIMRRGTAHAYAEVEYLGRDNRRYRARWSVRRARDRIDGAIQPQEMALWDVGSGKPLGDKKTGVLEEIYTTLGLTYDQFRRSALLAQGDFAAFLRANHDERANLLEQMTGTELYTKLSKAAFQKNKAVQDALKILEVELGHVRVLEPAERTQLEQRITDLANTKRQSETTVHTLDGILQWFRQREVLLRRENEALETEKIAQQALLELVPLYEELARVERAHRIRPLRDTARDAATTHKQALARSNALAEDARSALKRSEEATQRQANCKELLDAAVVDFDAAKSKLDEAAKLDSAVVENERHFNNAAKHAADAFDALEKVSKELAVVEGEIAKSAQRIKTLESLIEEKSAHVQLVQQWERWQSELKRYVSVANEERTAATAHPELKTASEQAARKRADAASTFQRAEDARRRAENELKRAEDSAQKIEMTEKLRLERDRLNERVSLLQTLLQLGEQATAFLKEEEEECTTEKTRRDDAAAAEVQVKKIEKKLERLDAAIEEAEFAHAEAKAAQGWSEHRAELSEGQPCPLCGSKRHPYVNDGTQFAGLVSSSKKRVMELQSERSELQERCAKHREDMRLYVGQADDAVTRAVRARKKYDARLKEWSRTAAELGMDVIPNELGQRAVRNAKKAAEIRRDEIKEIEERAAKLAEQVARQRKIIDRCRKDEASARDAMSAAEKAAERARQEFDKIGELLKKARVERETLEQALETPLAGWGNAWRKSLAANPAKFMTDCANAVSEYLSWTAERAQCESNRAALATKHQSLLATVNERKTIAEQRAHEQFGMRENFLSAQTNRSALFSGRVTAVVRNEYEDAVKIRRDALDIATAEVSLRRQQAAEAEAEARGAHEAARARGETAEQAEKALKVALETEQFDRESVEKLLERDESWVKAGRAEIEKRDAASKQAATVRAERARVSKEHEANGWPTMTPEEAASQHGTAVAAHDQATQDLADTQARLRSDNDARELYANKAQVVEARRNDAKQWKVLNDLIGHSEGKTFRIFAQSLTLDALLSHANEHLSELAPRYRLMRVPGQDLDLQIADQDMGDEIRSVNSLSGGESFLVSLALALGLSSLAAQNVRVETLFIDEGFGTLDPETLDTALAALETLQATGRQVGLISHVAGIAEQIGTEVRVERLGGGRSSVRIRDVSAKNAPSAAPGLDTSQSKGKGKNRGPKKVEIEA